MNTITINTEAVLANQIYLQGLFNELDVIMEEVNVYSCNNIMTLDLFAELLEDNGVEFEIN